MYNDAEIDLIKSVFAENDFVLIAVRKLLFGGDITKQEKKAIVDTFSKDEVVKVLQRKVYAEHNLETPVGQLSDFWLGAESQIFGASKDTIKQTIESKTIVLNMFRQAFKLLKDPDGEKVSTTIDLESMDDLGIKLIARNLYMQAIETGLSSMKVIAGMKDETLDQTLKRLQQDSSK